VRRQGTGQRSKKRCEANGQGRFKEAMPETQMRLVPRFVVCSAEFKVRRRQGDGASVHFNVEDHFAHWCKLERRRPEPDSMSSPIPSSIALFCTSASVRFKKARDLRNGKG
jgi:hypothetical protein